MGNVILIQWCNARIGNVLSLVSFLFSSLHPKCFRIKFLLLVGTDGASANIAVAGMKGLVEKELPWVFWSGAWLTGWNWQSKMLSNTLHLIA